jgi:diguanylate cyclase (GGDEF)-like protein
MNDKNFNSILLLAILITVISVFGIHFIPHKRLTLAPAADARLYLLSETLPDGTVTSEWTRDDHTQWRCQYPENFTGNYFACTLTLDLSKSINQGIDLSEYSQLNLNMDYQGSANKIRIAIRNYDSTYSRPDDGNSTKFNAIQVHTLELTKEIHLALSSFAVADWWLSQYNIPLSKSLPELNNAMVITLDFAEQLKPGAHLLTLNKLELEGEWISAELWYLTVLSIWMAGIFIYAIRRLLELNTQTKHDTQIINQLSSTNEQLQEETNKFRRLSTVDPLTQTYNRFGIDQIIASLNRHKLKTPNHPDYALMMIDIDHFKRVNDQWGHDTGDRVLQHIANTIQQHLRAGDYVGRWGGEEFIVIMPGANKTTAMELAEIIRAAIFNSQCEAEKPLSVTASFGVGQQLPNEDFASCFKRTDTALYQAKAQGRNYCVYADEVH